MSSRMWYATAVWHELIRINVSDDVMGGYRTYRTVASVAKGAGVSRMTARKYLEGFVSEKHAVKIGEGKTVMYGVNSEVYG